VREFADLMVTDHSSVNRSAIDLAKKLDIKPGDNPTARTLKPGGEANIAKLNGLKGGRVR
jgi:putative membrane protein